MNGRSRRRPPIFTRIPWWFYVLMAGASYAFLKYFAPDLAVAAGYPAISGLLPLLGPILTIGFLLLAAARLYDRDGQDQVPPTRPGQSTDGRSEEADPDRDLSGKQ